MLEPGSLEIRETRLGRTRTVTVPLRSISPEYERVVRRVPFWALLPVVLVVLAFFAGYYFLIRQDVLPRELAMYPALFGVAALWGATRLLRRFDCIVFRDHWQRELFVVVREENDVTECDAFIHALLDYLKAAEEGTAPSVTPEASSGSEPRPELKWKICLGAGVLATTLPLLNLIEPEMTFYIAAIVLGASTAGLLAAIAAFVEKERGRYWSLPGLVLCFVPYVFY